MHLGVLPYERAWPQYGTPHGRAARQYGRRAYHRIVAGRSAPLHSCAGPYYHRRPENRSGFDFGPLADPHALIHQLAGDSQANSSIQDVQRLKEIEPDGVDEVIIGRALYLGAIDIAEAIAVAEGGA